MAQLSNLNCAQAPQCYADCNHGSGDLRVLSLMLTGDNWLRRKRGVAEGWQAREGREGWWRAWVQWHRVPEGGSSLP